MSEKLLDVILPSFNDPRIKRAIRSVRAIDDIGTIRLIVIDGGSREEIVREVKEALAPEDLLVSEPDRGIFDALNKGLNLCAAPYMGWLGSDDMFTGQMYASEIVANLREADLLVGNVAMFRQGRVTRMTHAAPCAKGLWRIGFHNPHYGTFGRTELLCSERFVLGFRSADIGYFLRIFSKLPRVVTVNRVVTLQGEGGYSTRSIAAIISSNRELIREYGRYSFLPGGGGIAVLTKLTYKMLTRARYSLKRVEARSLLTWSLPEAELYST